MCHYLDVLRKDDHVHVCGWRQRLLHGEVREMPILLLDNHFFFLLCSAPDLHVELLLDAIVRSRDALNDQNDGGLVEQPTVLRSLGRT